MQDVTTRKSLSTGSINNGGSIINIPDPVSINNDLAIGNISSIKDSERGTVNFIVRDNVGSNRGPVYYVPADDFWNSGGQFDQSLVWGLDEADNNLRVRVQYSDGSVVTGSISLS